MESRTSRMRKNRNRKKKSKTNVNAPNGRTNHGNRPPRKTSASLHTSASAAPVKQKPTNPASKNNVSKPTVSKPSTGATLAKALELPSAEGYLLQRQQRWENHVTELIKSIHLLQQEEDLGQDTNEGIVESVGKLRQLNTALANVAQRQREDDAKKMEKTQNTLETQLVLSQRAHAQKDRELQEMRRQLQEATLHTQRQDQTLVSLRGVIQQLQRSEAELRADLQRSTKQATKSAQLTEQLEEQNRTIRLEKDQVAQRFMQLSRQLNAVATGHSRAQHISDAAAAPTMTMGSLDSGAAAGGATTANRADAEKWSVRQVAEWLSSHGFGKRVVDEFGKNAVDGDMLFDLTDSDLRDTLGISEDAQRRRLMAARASFA